MNPRIAALASLACLCLLALLPTPSAGAESTPDLLLYGGHDHKTFLGCLTCAETTPDSVCSDYGAYGSETSSESIWNESGTFGSDASPYSPWNSSAQDAPLIRDKDGNAYGYFTANEVHPDRTQIRWAIAILNFYRQTSDLEDTRKRMCGE